MLRYLGALFFVIAFVCATPSVKAAAYQINTCPGYGTHFGWNPDLKTVGASVGAGCTNSYLYVPDGGGGSSSGGGGGPGGGGGTQTSVSTTITADKKNSKAPPCLRVGDPIDPGTGAKVDIETDFALPGEMGLKFERYYASRGIRAGLPNGPGGWTDNLDYELHTQCMGGLSCTTAFFMRPDGSEIKFTQPVAAASGAPLTGPFTEEGGGGLATLTYTPNGSGPGTYTVVDEDAMVYTWTQDLTTGPSPRNKGILTGIHDASGIGWTITYPNSTTTVVTHTSGQQMVLTITIPSNTGGQGISALTVTDPAGNNYTYQAASDDLGTWNLIPAEIASASFPGSNPVTVQYQYKPFDPNTPQLRGLTEVDYNGVAHDLTTYDTNGNALSTSLADGTQKTSLVYGSNATGAVVTITNPLGHVSVYQYNASALPISVTGQASSHCAATLSQMSYDGNGNMQSEVDNNGNTTTYLYAATGQLQQTVEASGTSIARTTTYQWDS
ncbi:DUF6531 domain-containing protein, partial [Dyella sp.]|uniref:DUF6531 domain-containing protein n=1 Tax=Dyella sp. TaxID=1869338 RepID=UPI002B47BB6C